MDSAQEKFCATCTVPPQRGRSDIGRLSGWPGLTLLLLPKCPFCVVAYTSSMAVCGAPSLVEHHVGWGSWLAIGLAGLCVGSIARNNRGPGTRAALFMACLGLVCLLIGLYRPDSLLFYYLGGALLLLGSVSNGPGYRWFRKRIPTVGPHVSQHGA